MSFFRRPDYTSDTTQFIAELHQQRPELEANQRRGRSLLWDLAVDRTLWSEYRAAQIRQPGYVYQTNKS